MKRTVKIQLDEEEELLAIHIAADSTTLRELRDVILIECHKKGIPYVHQDHQD